MRTTLAAVPRLSPGTLNPMENFRLRVFRAVARHSNFRMAAEELLLTQPAVTQQIKALEQDLDAALFNRAGGRVALTAAGAALLPFAERLGELANEAREAVAATASRNAGTLSIGASQTIGQYLLPRFVAAFLAENPKVDITIVGGNTQTVLEGLAAGRIALALVEGPALRQDVRLQTFLEDRMLCVVPPGHPWSGKPVSITELQTASFVMRELGSGSRRVVEQALEQAGLQPRELKVRMTFDSTEGLLTAVEAGLGVTFVSRWAARPRLLLGVLRIARVQGLRLSRPFSLATLAGPEPAGLPGAFHRFVMERAAALMARPELTTKSR